MIKYCKVIAVSAVSGNRFFISLDALLPKEGFTYPHLGHAFQSACYGVAVCDVIQDGLGIKIVPSSCAEPKELELLLHAIYQDNVRGSRVPFINVQNIRERQFASVLCDVSSFVTCLTNGPPSPVPVEYPRVFVVDFRHENNGHAIGVIQKPEVGSGIGIIIDALANPRKHECLLDALSVEISRHVLLFLHFFSDGKKADDKPWVVSIQIVGYETQSDLDADPSTKRQCLE